MEWEGKKLEKYVYIYIYRKYTDLFTRDRHVVPLFLLYCSYREKYEMVW